MMKDGNPVRILFVTSEIPYPPDNGVWIKSFHALRLAAQLRTTLDTDDFIL